MPLQKDQIIHTAIRLLDRDGVEGVTLRRLASELDVKAPALYWHIANKQTLLDEMANAILNERFEALDFADDQREWAAWLETMANELRAALLAHREGARIVAGAHLNVALTLTRLIDLNIRVLHNAGFSYLEASRISTTVVTFTFGFVIEEQSSPPIFDGDAASHGALLLTDFSAIAQILQVSEVEFFDTDERFNACLGYIIGGVRAAHETSETSETEPPL
jgi:TetR/AcrR family tetracycline transcriptional repressor